MKNKTSAIICLFVILSYVSTSIHAKDATGTIELWGHVKDAFSNLAITNVKITLMDKDSVILDTMHVLYFNEGNTYMDSYYKFTIPAKPQSFIIKAEHPDFKTTYVNFAIKHVARNSYFDAPWHYMKRKPKPMQGGTLREVEVKATRLKVIFRKDTVIYNADAFNLPSGSMLDDLIRQFPGAKLTEDGEIFMNGRKVDNLLLEGKDFFKKDKHVMMQNLPSYVVKNIQLYEKQTDKSKYLGYNADKKDFVMDVKLKREYSRNYLANIESGIGTYKRYTARAFGLRFTPHSRFSVFANLNNINEYLRPGSDGEWQITNLQTGKLATKEVGMDWSFSNRKETFSNEFYSDVQWRSSDNQTISAQESFLTSGHNFVVTNKTGKYDALFVMLTNELKITSPLYLEINTFGNYLKSDGTSNQLLATFNSNPFKYGSSEQLLDSAFYSDKPMFQNMLVNRQRTQIYGYGYDLTMTNNMKITQKLPWGDNIDIELNGGYKKSDNSNFNKYQIRYYQPATTENDQDQYFSEPDHQYWYSADAQYNIHLRSNWNYTFLYQYEQRYTSEHHSKYRLDKLSDWDVNAHHLGDLPSSYDSLLIATDLSNSYQRREWQKKNMGGIKINYEIEKEGNTFRFDADIPITYLSDKMHYLQSSTDTIVRRGNLLWNPNTSISYTTSRGMQLEASYMFNMGTPELRQLINNSNTSNPLVVYLGNPSLKNSRSHDFHIGFSDRKNSHQLQYNASADVHIDKNSIANGFIYNQTTGIYTYRPMNIDGNWYITTRAGFSTAVGKDRLFTFDDNAAFTYNRNVDFTSVKDFNDAVLSRVNNCYLTDKIKLAFQKNKLRASLVMNVDWRNSTSETENFSTINVFDFNYGLICNYTLLWGINLATDIKMYSRRGYSDSYMNTDNLIWNASVAKPFLKNKLTVKLSGYDILRNISNTEYIVNGQGRTETWNNTIPSYMMFSVLYRINSVSNK